MKSIETFLNFIKNFDTLNHDIWLHKSKFLGMKANALNPTIINPKGCRQSTKLVARTVIIRMCSILFLLYQ